MPDRLTDALVRRAEPPETKQAFTWDSETRGFALRVTAGGAKSFVLDYRVAGRQRRITIGRYPDWSVAAARAEARELKRAASRGSDPMGERHAERATPTVRDLWTRYRDEHLANKAPRSRADQATMWEGLILPAFGTRRLNNVGRSDVAALHRSITRDRGTPVRANRVVEVLRKAFNLAIEWGWCTENPAIGVVRNREDQRHRYLSQDELARLFAALDRHPERVSASAIKFLALTGARKSEVLGARWEMFDLAAGVWTKPAAFTKQRKQHRVPLSAAALEILREMQQLGGGNYVFPGRKSTEPLTDIKKSWESACRSAGLTVAEPRRGRDGRPVLGADGKPLMVERPSARIHDLRHTFASLLVSGGKSLPLIGAMLGHTQPQTTARYAHLYDEALREAADTVSAALLRAE